MVGADESTGAMSATSKAFVPARTLSEFIFKDDVTSFWILTLRADAGF